MRWKVLAGLFVILALAVPLRGQDPDPRNAARWYGEAIDRYEGIVASMEPGSIGSLSRRMAAYLKAPDEPPPAEVATFLEALLPALDSVRRAGRSPYLDFELIDADGPEMDLPHLSYLRRFARLLGAEAMLRFHAGDDEGAAVAMAGMYRLAEDAASDELLVSSAVGAAIFDEADHLTQWAIDRARIGPIGASGLHGAMRRIDPGSPFRLIGAVESERSVMLTWFVERFQGEGGIELFREEFGGQMDEPSQRVALTMMNQAEFEGALRAAEIALDRAIEVLAIEDPDRARHELERLEGEIARGHHGALARMLVPDLLSIHDRIQVYTERISARATLLEAIAAGRIAPLDAANAAVWYRRAIATWGLVPAEARVRLLAFADDVARSVDQDLDSALVRAAPTVELVRQAAAIERCDFRDRRPPYPIGAAPDHAGLRDLIRVLHAGAIRDIRGERYDDVIDWFVVCFRIVAHLSADGTITGSLLAQHAFERTRDLLAPGLASDVFTLEQRMVLLRAARDASYRDPFGYGAAFVGARAGLGAWITASAGPLDPEQERDEISIGTALAACDGDQLLFLLFCIERIQQGATEAEEPDTLAPLADLLALESLRRARGQAPTVLRLVRERRFGELTVPLAPRIGHVVERQERAKDLLRTTLVAIRGQGNDGSATGQ